MAALLSFVRDGSPGRIAGRDNDASGGFDPLSRGADAGEVMEGADDIAGGGRDVVRALGDVGKAEAKIAVAPLEEPRGVSVAIDAAPSHVVLLGNGVRADPVEEFLVNHRAERMFTDRAVEFVELSSGEFLEKLLDVL